MVVTKRIAAILGSVALASTLAACGGGPQEVDADENDQSQGSDAGGSSEESEGQTNGDPDDPFDGELVTISKITDFNSEDVCNEVFGPGSDDLFEALGVEAEEGVESTYSNWEATYDEEAWNIAPTLGCHAFINKDATDESKRAIHIFVTEKGNDWHEGATVTVNTSNESVKAGISLSAPAETTPDDETIAQYINDDVLPKFKP